MMGKPKIVKTLRARRAITGYCFILPFIIGFIMFMAKPLVQSFYMSFCDVKVIGGVNPEIRKDFIGLTNYIFAFTGDPAFNRLMTEQVGYMVINSVATLVLSFVIAVFLNQNFKGRTFVRAVFFLPVILSSGVMVGLETNNSLLSGISSMIAESTGVNLTGALEDVLRLSGVGTRAFQVAFDIINRVYDIVIASGIQIIVFLSGLQTIPPSLYEAADVEGCSRWESFWKITFPMVSPLLLVNMVYTIIDFFMKSGPAIKDDITDTQGVLDRINDVLLRDYNFGLASAMSWVYFAIAAALIGVSTFIISKGVHYDD